MSVVPTAGPDKVLLELGLGEYAMIGHSNTSSVFMEASARGINDTGPIYAQASVHGKVRQIHQGFDGWFTERYEYHRRQYSDAEWSQWAVNPREFSIHEQRIVRARRCYAWKVLELKRGRFEVEIVLSVRNGSEMMLPFISLDAVERGGSQRIYAPTSHIAVGAESIVRTVANLKGPIEIADAPEALPEDIENYREFDTVS